MQFLVQIEVALPPEMPRALRDRLLLAELERGRALHREGVIAAIWAVRGGLRNVGIWEAEDEAALDRVLEALPLAHWLTAEVTPLVPLDFDAATAALQARP